MHFRFKSIKYSELSFFTSLVKDYLADAPILHPLKTYTQDASLHTIIEKRNQFFLDREAIHDVLKTQHQKHDADFPRIGEHIDLLLKPNTYTVCTAHQPHIAFGPLYILYKTIHAIQLAKQYASDYPGYNFLPVFFIGSEDADKGELLQLDVDHKTSLRHHTAERGAVGRMQSARAEAFLHSLYKPLKHLPHFKRLERLLSEAYAKPTLSAAFRHILYTLFGDEGLIVLDIDDANLKKIALPIFEKEVSNSFSQPLLEKNTAYLDEHYGWHQLQGNPINLFHLESQLRKKLVFSQGKIMLPHEREKTLYTREEYLDFMSFNPEKVSPSAVLRPLVQEYVLPNVTFIGGGSEVAYWMQLKRIFEEASVHFPLVALRNSYQLVAPQHAQVLRYMGIEPLDIFDHYPLQYENVEKNALFTSLSKKREDLDKATKSYLDFLRQSNYPHAMQLDSSRKQIAGQLDKLENKLLGQVRQKTGVAELGQTFQSLFPFGELQERSNSFVSWYARYGDEWVSALKQHCQPESKQFLLVEIQPSN